MPRCLGCAPDGFGCTRTALGVAQDRDLRSCFGELEKMFQPDFVEAYPKSRFAHQFGDFGYISMGREGRAGVFRYTLQTRAIGATVSAGALHAQGWGFESLIAHHVKLTRGPYGPSFFTGFSSCRVPVRHGKLCQRGMEGFASAALGNSRCALRLQKVWGRVRWKAARCTGGMQCGVIGAARSADRPHAYRGRSEELGPLASLQSFWL